MLEIYKNVNREAYNALKANKQSGNYITEYISKYTDIIHKERVAASLISSDTLEIMCQYENTLINISKAGVYSDTMMSNKKLSYIALISIIYTLRLLSLEVSAVANIAYKNDCNILSVEGLGNSRELAKVVIPDFMIYYLEYVMEEARNHIRDKFMVCQLINKPRSLASGTVYMAILNSYSIVDTYTLKSNNSEIVVVETRSACFVIYNDSLVLVSRSIQESTEPLEEYLKTLRVSNKLEFTSTVFMI